MGIRFLYFENGAVPVAFCDYCDKPVPRDDGQCVFFEGKIGDAVTSCMAHKGKCTNSLLKMLGVDSINAMDLSDLVDALNSGMNPEFIKSVKVKGAGRWASR